MAFSADYLPKLRLIGFYGNGITDNGLKALIGAVSKLTSL
jgi:hypothetical protein